ncbi:MAG: O-antigen ligase family protein [Thermoleophilia bacterium]|nr:O-antigen ligase family protein [Thermoleophilia bacterium]
MLLKTSAVLIFSTLMVMAIEAFAVFANGAYFPDAMTLCIVGAWAIFLFLVFTERDEIIHGWTHGQIVLLGLAAASWLWVGLSMRWSIAADQTWIDFNRTGGYFAIFAIGILIGRFRLPRRLAPVLLLAVITAAAVYGLGAKALPSVVENADEMGRLAIPIGYVNAMGLLMALGYVLSIYLMAAKDFHWIVRLLSAMASPLLLVGLFFTVSRGAAIALFFGLLIYFAIVPLRLRGFGAMALAIPPAFLVARWSSAQSALMNNNVNLDDRLSVAPSLRLYLLLAVLWVAVIFSVSLLVGKRINFSPKVNKVVGAFLIIAISSLTIFTTASFALSKPSVGEWASEAFHNLKYGIPTNEGSARLLEMGSSGRWRLWEVAVQNWQENPVKGSGGQSFPITHLLKRDDGNNFVKQPHGHPFQLLSELGIIGFALGMAFISIAMAFSVLLLCRLNDRWERSLAGALIAMLVVYLIHAAYDWDWNMFALTMIYFFFTGLLIGWPRPETGEPTRAED